MKLSDGVETGIHCAAMLAGIDDGAAIPAASLANFHGVSPSYLLKQLAKLVEAGLFESVPGPSGGYRLAKPATAITLLDIVLAIEGREPAFRCNEIRRAGPDPLPDGAYPHPCGIKMAMLRAEKAYRTALSQVSLDELTTEHVSTSDPRVIARGCAFIETNSRRSK